MSAKYMLLQSLLKEQSQTTAVLKFFATTQGNMVCLKGNMPNAETFTFFIMDAEGNWDLCTLSSNKVQESTMPTWNTPFQVLLCQQESPCFYGSSKQEAYNKGFYQTFLEKLEVVESEGLFTEGNTEELIDEMIEAYDEVDQKQKNYAAQTFFQEVLPSLTTLFQTCPRDELLEDMVMHSKWVRAYQKNDCLLVGIIYKDNQPKYVSLGKPVMDVRHYQKEFNQSYVFVLNKKQPLYFGYELLFLDANSGKPVCPLKSA